MNKKHRRITALLMAALLAVMPVSAAFAADGEADTSETYETLITEEAEYGDGIYDGFEYDLTGEAVYVAEEGAEGSEYVLDEEEDADRYGLEDDEEESGYSVDEDEAAVPTNGIQALGIQPFAASSSTDVTTVYFTNAPVNSPDLYVTKTTQDVYGDVIETDDEFSFIVKFDDEFAKEETYTVYNADGEEVFLYSEGESTEDKSNKKPFKTDKYGTFTLKAGQTARFENVGTGVAYEVYEEDADGWTRILPVGDSALGTITKNGSTVEFVNVKSDDSSQLVVYKTISFPDGYEAPETPDFTFKLTISGKAYNNELYTIIDMNTLEEVGTGVTDENGQFTLKGWQEAIFEVSQDVDYKVEEVLDDEGNVLVESGSNGERWRITTASSYEGSTGFNQTVIADFNNAAASFAVSKHVQDSENGAQADESLEFTFVLMDADRNAMPNVGYYLYHTDGTPYTDEDGDIIVLYTDSTGCFTLTHGQTAIFFGIDAGTTYSVREMDNQGYTQIVPSTNDGYMDKVVSDNVELLPFVNEAINQKGNLIVSKAIQIGEGVELDKDSDGNDIPLDTDVEFTFGLYKDTGEADDDGEEIYEPIPGAVYTVNKNGTEETHETDELGQFTICANDAAVFESLEYGDYKVKELRTSSDYYLGSITSNSGGLIVKDADGTGYLGTGGLSLTFINIYDPNKFAVELIKSDRDDEPLEGAEFILYYNVALTTPVYTDEYGEPLVLTTDEEGKILLWDPTSQMDLLETGTYYLEEIKAPEGYSLLAEPIIIDIRRDVDGEEHGFVFTVNGIEYTEESTDTDPVGQIWVTNDGDEGIGEVVHIRIYNDKPFELPITGGMGIALILLVGIAGISVISYKTLKKKD